MRLTHWGSVVVATALVLAGCSSSAETDYDLPVGPISERVADQFHGNLGEAVNALLDHTVADCMRTQGFDYQVPGTRGDVPAWDTLEYAQTYGYGITTWADLPQPATATIPPDEDYRQALWGDEQPPDEAATWVPGGCYGQALVEMELLGSTIVQDVDDMHIQAQDDTRVVTALAGWATCMADEGYSYATPQDAQAAVVERAAPGGHALAGASLKALRAEEIATAVADHGCATDLRRAKATVIAELESYYYAQHTTEVDALLARLDKLEK
ncbi:MAG: hypothetical protein FWF02_12350 [Micrococcales bacterium]|nr:hypothetical protein [Micrococcales bacterium]MCL2668469.1 hypothetical protein [Micrococcales bacterium]